jgi:hypothetical protein
MPRYGLAEAVATRANVATVPAKIELFITLLLSGSSIIM